MKALKYSKQKGFTLVEIAIVMVIIGLLLGAVLKGQNLINSARVRSMIDQKNGIQAAYYGFRARYQAMPGDMTPADATAAIGSNNLLKSVGGDGNGLLNVDDYGEAAAVWAHLSAANFIIGNYDGDKSYTAKTSAPVNPFGGRVILWRTAQYQKVEAATATSRLGFVVGRNTPVMVLLELDTKLGHGRPDTGFLRAMSGTETTAEGQEAICVSGSTWNISSDSQDCNAIFLY